MNCNFCSDVVWGYYTVHNEVWRAAGLHPHDFCCLRCLESRLGRPLNVHDFPPAPINRMVYAGAGLQAEFDAELTRREQEYARSKAASDAEWEKREQRKAARKAAALARKNAASQPDTQQTFSW